MLFPYTFPEESARKQTLGKLIYYKGIEIKIDEEHYIITLTIKILNELKKA